MKENIESLKNGSFEKIDLNDLKVKFEKDKKYIIDYFNIENNIKNDNTIDFKNILEIKSSLEKGLLSINNNFNNLYEEFKNIG